MVWTVLRAGVVAFLVVIHAVVASFAADSTNDGTPAGELICDGIDADTAGARFDALPYRTTIPPFRYPAREIDQLGEGWVRFAYTVDDAGTVKDIWLKEALGSPVYGERSVEVVRAQEYKPGIVGGNPAAFGLTIEISFLMEGENRADARASYRAIYDRAYDQRQKGRYAESLVTLQDAMKRPLNLYELATMSHALTLTYLGLGDWRRALRHSRHAALSDGHFADSGVRARALAINAELLARDNAFHDALCANTALRKQYPSFAPSPALQDAIARSRSELAGTNPIRTEVEIIESSRTDIPAHWPHRLARSSFSIDHIEGKIDRFRLDCLTLVRSGPIEQGTVVVVGPNRGVCRLYVFGDPGAKFALEER